MDDKPLGMAADFYRLRVVRVDEGDAPDLEWREDILYRSPPAETPEEYDAFVVQAVEIDDEEAVTHLETFTDGDEARDFLERAGEELTDLTRTEFEARYFASG